MIKAVIITDVRTYVMAYPGITDINEVKKDVNDTLNAGDYFINDSRLIRIGPGAIIKEIVIYDDAVTTLEGQPAAGSITDELYSQAAAEQPQPEEKYKPGQAYNFKYNTVYLGLKLIVEGVCYAGNNHDLYFLPMEADKEPINNKLSTRNQNSVMWQILEAREAEYTGYRVEVIIPFTQLADYDDAESYIQDYIADMEKDQEYKSDNPTAKAWQGWKEGGK